jgi:hypothetical protein
MISHPPFTFTYFKKLKFCCDTSEEKSASIIEITRFLLIKKGKILSCLNPKHKNGRALSRHNLCIHTSAASPTIANKKDEKHRICIFKIQENFSFFIICIFSSCFVVGDGGGKKTIIFFKQLSLA